MRFGPLLLLVWGPRFSREHPVYLLYMDESGTPTGEGEQYFVVAGVAVHEEDCWPLNRSVQRLVDSLLPVPQSGHELHASRIWSGRQEWSAVPRSARDRLLDGAFAHIAGWTSPAGRAPRYLAVAVHKPSFAGRDVVQMAHEELFLRFSGFLGRIHNTQGQNHRAIVVADRSGYEDLVQRLVPRWKVSGTHAGRLHAFAEVPLFVDSRATRNIQVADLVAWAVWRYYERDRQTHIQCLNRRFGAAGGIQHGLTHLVRGYARCACVACASRRGLGVASTVPSLKPSPGAP
ncbi:MAG: DUF3800 domain-containing protein [Actinobacteria bacterium]|nr:DUF3800 domain-containing protein [Actinomycetota bacterium]